MPPASLQPVAASAGPWPLHDAAASRAAELAALSTHPPYTLMARAGLAVARLARALAPHAGSVQVWAGPGNNGGDGLVAARHLHAAGLRVQVALIGDTSRMPADAAWALQQAVDAGVAVQAGVATGTAAGTTAGTADIDIDALLGLGATRAPDGEMAAAIAALQAAGGPVLAVDLPSGLHADTGALLGTQALHAVRATATLSLLTLKPGLFTARGRDQAGAVWLDTLGVAAGPASAWLAGPPARTARRLSSHKGDHGDVLVVGGDRGMVGAVWLAARAALAAGAGRVYCSPLDPDAALLDPTRPELMGRRAGWLQPPQQLAASTVACGCGGGAAVRAALPPLLSWVPRLVLDADALNAIANDPTLQRLLQQRADRGLATLLTPHPLEAARLLGLDTRSVQADRLAHAAALAARHRCTVLLKGSGTVIAAPGCMPLINPTGNAALASAGTGDVLAGWAAGSWAQQPAAAAADIAAAAAWQHGAAADTWAPALHGAPLRASGLIEVLARGGPALPGQAGH